MAFLVQNDSGTIENANSMVTVQEFYDYMTDRNKDYTVIEDYPVVSIQAALIRATDYINTRFKYVGTPKETDQATSFPRDYLYDLYGNLIEVIPVEVKKDTYELTGYLLDNATAQLYQNITPEEAGIKSKSSRVDVLSEKIDYLGSKSSLDLVVGLANNIKMAGYIIRKGGLYI